MERRTFLTHSLWTTAGLATGVGCSNPSVSDPSALPPATDLDALARAILACSTNEVVPLALRHAEAGASPRDLLGAAYLAGLQEIDPRPIGGQYHALMMVASAAETTAALRGRDKLLPALFNLQRVKRSQGRDASDGDWSMPPAPEPETATLAEHDAAFAAAMRDWDPAAGDAPVTALHASLSMDAFFERIWPWAARDFRVIGHKIIYAAQTYRALQEIGWRHGRDAVRSLARGILDENPFDMYSDEESQRILALYDHNRARSARFPADWQSRGATPEHSRELLTRMREADAEGAADAVLAMLDRGAGAQSIWDGIRLFAFELTMQYPSIAGVHTVTSVNALHRAARITNVEATRRLCILQAASWMPLFPALLKQRVRAPREVAIETLADAVEPRAAEPFAAETFEDGARRAAALVESGDPDGFRARALAALAHKARHDHDYKYTVAAVEEIGAAQPGLRPILAAASMGMLRTASTRDNDLVRLLATRGG